MNIDEIIKILKLEPLDLEGGMYRSTYTSEEVYGDRPVGTAIYYLLTPGSYSHLHRLTADEVYHFYLGDPVELYSIGPEGQCTRTVLGQDLASGEQVQALVPKNAWQGSRLIEGGSFALLGTTMSPGYSADDYEHADPVALAAQYPDLEAVIERLTGETKFL